MNAADPSPVSSTSAAPVLGSGFAAKLGTDMEEQPVEKPYNQAEPASLSELAPVPHSLVRLKSISQMGESSTNIDGKPVGPLIKVAKLTNEV